MTYQVWLVTFWMIVFVPAFLLGQQSPAGQVIPTTGQFDPVREPHFAAAAQADFLKDSDHVMGVSANGVSKAYRTDIITYHHIIHDQLGKMPILATW